MENIIYNKGWNLTGFTENKTLNEIRIYFQDKYIEGSLYSYNNTIGYENVTDNVEVNKGYWIKLSEEVTVGEPEPEPEPIGPDFAIGPTTNYEPATGLITLDMLNIGTEQATGFQGSDYRRIVEVTQNINESTTVGAYIAGTPITFTQDGVEQTWYVKAQGDYLLELVEFSSESQNNTEYTASVAGSTSGLLYYIITSPPQYPDDRLIVKFRGSFVNGNHYMISLDDFIYAQLGDTEEIIDTIDQPTNNCYVFTYEEPIVYYVNFPENQYGIVTFDELNQGSIIINFRPQENSGFSYNIGSSGNMLMQVYIKNTLTYSSYEIVNNKLYINENNLGSYIEYKIELSEGKQIHYINNNEICITNYDFSTGINELKLESFIDEDGVSVANYSLRNYSIYNSITNNTLEFNADSWENYIDQSIENIDNFPILPSSSGSLINTKIINQSMFPDPGPIISPPLPQPDSNPDPDVEWPNGPNDTHFSDQWHLNNTGQTNGVAGVDVNILDCWNLRDNNGDFIRGKNINVAIIDSGVDYTHKDLYNNFKIDLSYDTCGSGTNDVYPLGGGSHGTCCACLVGAKGNNDYGTVGTAPNCNIAGIKIFDPNYCSGSDQSEAFMLTYKKNDTSIYSNSWGPGNDGLSLAGPGPLTQQAIKDACETGRQGKGNIYVFSAGNGLLQNDNSNKNGYANNIYTIAVGAINHKGVQSFYSEPGANMLITAPSNGDNVGIVTGDIAGSNGYSNNDITYSFGGTSAACPIVSGIIALILQANPNLTWRDVQYIILQSATKNSRTEESWTNNKSQDPHFVKNETSGEYEYSSQNGYHINHKYGFGLINATGAVLLAKKWETDNLYVNMSTKIETIFDRPYAIPDYNNSNPEPIILKINITESIKIEHIELIVDIDHTFRGDLKIEITSPSGTNSILVDKHEDPGYNYSDWALSSVRHWGESSLGEWTIVISDLRISNTGTLQNMQLNLYGVN